MTYVSLFKGINVGGKNIVKMAELKQMLSKLGFQNVKTYIQSGNAMFDSCDTPDKIKENIKTAFQNTFNFESNFVLQTKDNLDTIIKSLPFPKEKLDKAAAATPDVEHLYFYFTDNTPSASDVDALNSSCESPDMLSACTHGVYLLCHDSVRNSKLAIALAKKQASATARNWKTLNKLFEMM